MFCFRFVSIFNRKHKTVEIDNCNLPWRRERPSISIYIILPWVSAVRGNILSLPAELWVSVIVFRNYISTGHNVGIHSGEKSISRPRKYWGSREQRESQQKLVCFSNFSAWKCRQPVFRQCSVSPARPVFGYILAPSTGDQTVPVWQSNMTNSARHRRSSFVIPSEVSLRGEIWNEI